MQVQSPDHPVAESQPGGTSDHVCPSCVSQAESTTAATETLPVLEFQVSSGKLGDAIAALCDTWKTDSPAVLVENSLVDWPIEEECRRWLVERAATNFPPNLHYAMPFKREWKHPGRENVALKCIYSHPSELVFHSLVEQTISRRVAPLFVQVDSVEPLQGEIFTSPQTLQLLAEFKELIARSGPKLLLSIGRDGDVAQCPFQFTFKWTVKTHPALARWSGCRLGPNSIAAIKHEHLCRLLAGPLRDFLSDQGKLLLTKIEICSYVDNLLSVNLHLTRGVYEPLDLKSFPNAMFLGK